MTAPPMDHNGMSGILMEPMSRPKPEHSGMGMMMNTVFVAGFVTKLIWRARCPNGTTAGSPLTTQSTTPATTQQLKPAPSDPLDPLSPGAPNVMCPAVSWPLFTRINWATPLRSGSTQLQGIDSAHEYPDQPCFNATTAPVAPAQSTIQASPKGMLDRDNVGPNASPPAHSPRDTGTWVSDIIHSFSAHTFTPTQLSLSPRPQLHASLINNIPPQLLTEPCHPHSCSPSNAAQYSPQSRKPNDYPYLRSAHPSIIQTCPSASSTPLARSSPP
ncbi:hypothetical protein PtA15_5A857 [Puccinia triticina]|uniref:Uncharacterized protein n=1 Tax=Puccinia triticina TaxID=208348 RepID=A0ABY7CLD0_9BASI|nr:uncharacterized protein PtA15_5A857 [Puccinia triticina]WAQ85282.1 hypothetical protein PtA15_5A857 [Puccinia triticina]